MEGMVAYTLEYNAIGRQKFEKRLMYSASFAAPFIGFYLLRGSTRHGSTDIHTIMEVVATLLALMVGVSALMRFYTKRNNTLMDKPI